MRKSWPLIRFFQLATSMLVSSRITVRGSNMEKNTLVNGHFIFKTLPDGTIDKTQVICSHCKKVFNYHRSISSLRYHLSAKHVGVDTSREPKQTTHQTTLDAACGRPINQPRSRKLEEAIAKWVATSCRPVFIVEDRGLKEIIRIASNDYTYEPPSRQTITRRIHELYEKERGTRANQLEHATTVALTGDHWTSLGNHN